MLAEERFSLIMEQLNRKRTVTVQELCEALNTSESTIRRDLTELDRLGKLNKVHGGATLPDSRFLADEPTMEAKESQAVEQKRSIAQAAAELINADDFVFIDAGSTTLELVRALAEDALKASYVTNGVAHARALAQKNALQRGDFAEFLHLIRANGHSSFESCQNVYCASDPRHQGLSIALALSQSILEAGGGAWRMQGGGFAGTIQAFVPAPLLEAYCAAIESVFGPGSCYRLKLREQGAVQIGSEM